MKHFVIFVVLIFSLSYVFFLKRTEDSRGGSDSIRIFRVFGYSSFTGQWGPGPELKKIFEKDCQCKVEFVEGSDSGILLQRLSIEGESLGADLVVGFDQFDLSKAQDQLQWKPMNLNLDLVETLKNVEMNRYFVPYDWGVLTFVARRSDNLNIHNLDQLLDSSLAGQIALQDPRTSSPGLQFLNWVIKSKGEEEGFKFIRSMMKQAHSHSPSWSSAYGLFTNRQAKLVFSYVTSPIYHLINEKDDNYVALEFSQGHPMQVEFVGIPNYCHNCDLSEKFINLMLSPEGQKIIMQKNYMFPVIRGVKEGTEFDTIPKYPISVDLQIPNSKEIESLLKKWAEIRRTEGL